MTGINNFIKKLGTYQIGILFFIVTLLTYSNSLFNSFVYDDFNYLVNNLQEHSLNIGVLFGNNLFNMAGQYRPISATYLALLYSIFGSAAFPYHFLQILIHVAIAVLLFLIFKRFLGKTPSIVLCILFLVHPMNTEAVSYIASSQDLLFNLFGLGALFLWMRATKNKNYIYPSILLLLSLLTKEEGIVYIFLIFFYTIIFERKKLLGLGIIGVCTVSIYFLIRIFVGQVYFSTRLLAPIASLSLPERLLNIPIIIFHYLATFFYPMALAVDQQWVIKTATFSSFYYPLIIDVMFLLIAAALGFYIFKHERSKSNIFIFFLLWFLVGLAPHLQIFPLDFTVTDRWFYFPMMGLFGLIGTIYLSVINKIKIPKMLIFLAVVIIFGLLSARTFIRNFDWKDDMTLFFHDIQIEDNYDIEIFLGNEYLNAGNYNKALFYLNRSVKARPNELNLHNLGVIYERMDDLQKAQEYYHQALNAKDYKIFYPHKHDLSSYNSYASLLVFYGDPNDAVQFINEGLDDYPDADTLLFFLSLAKLKLKDENGALAAAYKAYSINPDNENTYLYSHIVNKEPMTITVYGKNFDF
jgi:tetratricopeptide (TPR) repeat protein